MKKTYVMTTIISIAIFSLLSCSTTISKKGPQPLRQNSMFDGNLIPGPLKYEGQFPGENALLPRGFDGAPPQVPHDVSGFTIQVDNNDCITCHDPEMEAEKTPVIPVTHFESGNIDMRRYQCSLCHVPLSDAKPLVKNENDVFILRK